MSAEDRQDCQREILAKFDTDVRADNAPADKYNLDLDLAYRDAGFYLSLRAEDDDTQQIPRDFRNVTKKGSK